MIDPEENTIRPGGRAVFPLAPGPSSQWIPEIALCGPTRCSGKSATRSETSARSSARILVVVPEAEARCVGTHQAFSDQVQALVKAARRHTTAYARSPRASSPAQAKIRPPTKTTPSSLLIRVFAPRLGDYDTARTISSSRGPTRNLPHQSVTGASHAGPG